jgi:hypothetical protein
VLANIVEPDEIAHTGNISLGLNSLPCLLLVDDFSPLAVSMIFSAMAALIVNISRSPKA